MKFRNVAFASTAAVIAAVAIGTGAAQATSLIGSHDIKDDSIRSIDVRDGGVHRHDLGLGLQAKINKHASLTSYVESVKVEIPAGQKAEGTAWCHPGDLAVGGGYSSNDQTNGWAKIYQNRMTWAGSPANDDHPDGWYAQALGGGVDSDMYVWTTCLAS